MPNNVAPPHPLPLRPQFLRRRRAEPQQLLHALPPLAPLAPPVLPSSEPAPGVDLNVDYQSEVAPFLGRCLVGTGSGCSPLRLPASACALCVPCRAAPPLSRCSVCPFCALPGPHVCPHLCKLPLPFPSLP